MCSLGLIWNLDLRLYGEAARVELSSFGSRVLKGLDLILVLSLLKLQGLGKLLF
jgi:hypothetical protein